MVTTPLVKLCDMRNKLGLAMLLVATASCGDDSPTAPSTVQVGGVWRGTERITAVSGGECFGTFQSMIAAGFPVREFPTSMSITQNGANLDVTATSEEGGNATYSGSAGQSTVVLTWVSCAACNLVGATCPNGAQRDVIKQSGSVNASVAGRSMSGTEGEIYNVFVAGTQTSVGTLSLTSSFTFIRQ